MDKQTVVRHTTEYHSTRERNKLVIDATTMCTNLKCMIVNERSQLPKVVYCMIPCIWHPGKYQTMVTENGSVIVRGWGKKEGWLQRGMREFFELIEFFYIFLYFNFGGGYMAIHLQNSKNYTRKSMNLTL